MLGSGDWVLGNSETRKSKLETRDLRIEFRVSILASGAVFAQGRAFRKHVVPHHSCWSCWFPVLAMSLPLGSAAGGPGGARHFRSSRHSGSRQLDRARGARLKLNIIT